MSQNQISNNIKYSSNMWMPNVKLFNCPKLPKFTILPKKDDVLTKHACRLSMLFPKVHISTIYKMLISYKYDFIEAIDMLLFTENIQKRYRRDRYLKLRKYTCARCVPRKRYNLFQQLALQDSARGNEKMCINFTFSKNNKDTQFEHNINISNYNRSQVNSCVSNTKIIYEEGTVNVVDTPESTKSIRLKLQKARTGQYYSSVTS